MVEKKNSRRRIIVLIIFLLLLAFCIFAVVMRFRNPKITLWDMIIPKKNVIKPRTPKLIESEKVTKKISAKDGGSVSVTSKNGYTYQLIIQPGVYNTDPTVNLTPLEEPPFTYPEDPANPQPPPPPDPGIDINVDPPNPPNPPPPGPVDPDDPAPDDAPTGIEVIVFPPRRTLPFGSGQAANPNQNTEIVENAGYGNIVNVLPKEDNTAKTPNEPNGTAPRTPPVLIFTRVGRVVHILPGSQVWANSGYDEPPDGTGAPIDGGDGTVTPEDPKDNKGKDQVDQAVANSGGRCSAEFIAAVLQVYAQAGLSGQDSAANRYGALLKECDKEIIGYIKRLCESDRRLLRRQDFVNARKLLTLTVVATPEMFDELTKLETSCYGYYTMVGNGKVSGGGGSGVTISSSIDASVCGYFDDLWTGKTPYELVAAAGGQHTYEGVTSFRLPARGGKFAASDKSGKSVLSIGGTVVDVAFPDLGFEGQFDSRYTVYLLLYPKVKVKIEIPLVSTTCPGDNAPPPIAPLLPGAK